MCYAASRRDLIPCAFLTIKKRQKEGNNVFFRAITHTLAFYTFLIKKPLKNRYTRKQPTHFSITPLRSKFKKNFKTRRLHNLICLRRWRLNPKLNWKPRFRNTHFLTIFNLKKVLLEKIDDFKSQSHHELYSNVYDYAIYTEIIIKSIMVININLKYFFAPFNHTVKYDYSA